jgi:hypothetical protein
MLSQTAVQQELRYQIENGTSRVSNLSVLSAILILLPASKLIIQSLQLYSQAPEFCFSSF